MALSEAVRLEREKRKQVWEDRLWSLTTDPNVKRLVLAALIIAYTTHCAQSKERIGVVQSRLAQIMPLVGLPMLAADAGITDKYALAAIAGATAGWETIEVGSGWIDAYLRKIEEVV